VQQFFVAVGEKESSPRHTIKIVLFETKHREYLPIYEIALQTFNFIFSFSISLPATFIFSSNLSKKIFFVVSLVY